MGADGGDKPAVEGVDLAGGGRRLRQAGDAGREAGDGEVVDIPVV